MNDDKRMMKLECKKTQAYRVKIRIFASKQNGRDHKQEQVYNEHHPAL
jgi:hypothetical protein